MFKRKRLYERGSSYRDTGIPCGNPKRVQTGEVMCMPGVATSAIQREDVETQGEQQLRAMAQKQLKTDLSLQELVSQQRHFTEAGQYKPITKEIRGMMELQQYQDVARGDQRVETLRQSGLTDSEIRLQLNKEGMDKGLDPVVKNKSTFGVHPDIEQAQLQAIETKIAAKKASLDVPDTFRGVKNVSRQEMDIERSLFVGTSRESNTLTTLLTEKSKSVTGHPNDPINQLPQLMADIEQRAREKVQEKRRRRRRNKRQGNKDAGSCDAEDKTCDSEGEDEDNCVIGCLTLEEMIALKQSQDGPHDAEKRTKANSILAEHPDSSPSTSNYRDCNRDMHDNNKSLLVKSSPTHDATDSDCRADEQNSETKSETDRKILRGPIEFLPVEYIEECRLSLEKIRELPKFSSYEPGSPSNVLYVKNLSPRVSERDLVSLFGRFQKETGPEIVYRLMTGRMRGQAFITFHNSDIASQALQLVNGFVLHGKPVIVQYGKRTTA